MPRPALRPLTLALLLLTTGCASTGPTPDAAEPAGAGTAAASAPAPAPPARSAPEEAGVREAAPEAPAAAASDSNDPLEGFNRAMYSFNETVDDYLLKPVARGYRAVLPDPVRARVSSFFDNLLEPMNVINNLLQGKPVRAASDLGRFAVNTTLGLLGLFDVATPMGLERHEEDFGQTLAVWGVGEGPYLVLPFLGPSTVRDGLAKPVDWYSKPEAYYDNKGRRNSLLVLEVIDTRQRLLDATDILEQAAGQDPYVFVREGFRQRRRSLVYDGNPPAEKPPDLLFEDDPPPAP
jgi:phospholipid-binding lipoprotein MlaA